MKEADSNTEKLTAQEKKRNRRIGDLLIYHASDKEIGKLELKDGQTMQVLLKDCQVAGEIRGHRTGKKTNVTVHKFSHPAYSQHKARLLKGAVLQAR